MSSYTNYINDIPQVHNTFIFNFNSIDSINLDELNAIYLILRRYIESNNDYNNDYGVINIINKYGCNDININFNQKSIKISNQNHKKIICEKICDYIENIKVNKNNKNKNNNKNNKNIKNKNIKLNLGDIIFNTIIENDMIDNNLKIELLSQKIKNTYNRLEVPDIKDESEFIIELLKEINTFITSKKFIKFCKKEITGTSIMKQIKNDKLFLLFLRENFQNFDFELIANKISELIGIKFNFAMDHNNTDALLYHHNTSTRNLSEEDDNSLIYFKDNMRKLVITICIFIITKK